MIGFKTIKKGTSNGSLNFSRKLGDSNPRYGYPYGSLANCWFQPLTQTSNPHLPLNAVQM